METLWQDLVNTDWHDYRGTERDEDLLERPGEMEQLLERWGIEGMEPATEETLLALRHLRMLLQHMIQALLEKHLPDERDIAMLNTYFEQAPSRLLLTHKGQHAVLEQVPYQHNWSWVFSKIAASFAEILVDHDPFRIKQCENPDCRWTYYDESNNGSRRWCEDSCANIMRVRRFRARQRDNDQSKKRAEKNLSLTKGEVSNL